MYVDGWILLAIYAISVLALGVSAYALWSLEEIRRYYEKKSRTIRPVTMKREAPVAKVSRPKGHWD